MAVGGPNASLGALLLWSETSGPGRTLLSFPPGIREEAKDLQNFCVRHGIPGSNGRKASNHREGKGANNRKVAVTQQRLGLNRGVVESRFERESGTVCLEIRETRELWDATRCPKDGSEVSC